MRPQLGADPPPGDLTGHLAHREAVRRHLAGHQRGAEPPGSLDGHHRTVPGDRAAGEHHPGRARADHALDDDAHGQATFARAPAAAVADRLVVVQAGPARAHPVKHGVGAADRQIAVLQPGEAGLRAVLHGGARPDRHRGHPKLLVRRCDLGPDLGWQRRRRDPGAQVGRGARDGRKIVRGHVPERAADRTGRIECGHDQVECRHGDHVAAGDGYPGTGQLTKGCRLAAGPGRVGRAHAGEAEDKARLTSHPRTWTIPRSPSTRTRWPVLIRLVASPVPTTAGMPYSRATIAACDIEPPMSETAALILPNTGAQLGAVTGQTRISPSRISPIWLTSVSTRAGPSTMPEEAPQPRISPSSGRSHASIVCWVTPQSMCTAGSLSASGTGPRAGGGDQARRASSIRLRSATMGWKWAAPSGVPPAAQASITSDSAWSTSVWCNWNTSSASASTPNRASSAPNLRILPKNSVVNQCSQ